MPVLKNRAIGDFPIGNLPLAAHHDALDSDGIQLNPHAWLDPAELKTFSLSTADTLVDPSGNPLAWRGKMPSPENSLLSQKSFLIIHSWDLLRANEQYLADLDQYQLQGQAHPLAIIEGYVKIGRGTRLLPGVYIEGNVIIGNDCKIGPNCYIRGNTSIGDHCHIGNAVEIKNSILLPHVHVGHLSYVGDSILGEGVNFGAGTITSNLRHDGKNHLTEVADKLIDTGRRKFGSIVGDGVHTGINTSIYPGRKIFPGTSTRPGEIVQRDLHP